MGEFPRDTAAQWSRRAGRWFALFAALSAVGFATAVLLPARDTVPMIVTRFVALLLAYGGAGFGWVTGSLAGALFLYSRQRRHE